jgi:hypothetical protein
MRSIHGTFKKRSHDRRSFLSGAMMPQEFDQINRAFLSICGQIAAHGSKYAQITRFAGGVRAPYARPQRCAANVAMSVSAGHGGEQLSRGARH